MSVGMLEEKRYTRRVSQVGNSLSVNIPKDLAIKLKMNKGDEIEVIYDEEKDGLVMKRVNRLPEGIRPEVLGAMNRAISKYDKALRNLKDR
ncbi:prevent host death protein [Gracilibacillus boraciitolerans JCM 21714]|uniref:Prevent host death protein n=1 Tax=Gracilibacillus boraciitolerans JCM 21714 TaxID=1298598 RepID=W4VQI1_9BACI|nr:AbrB/MazE/SpoVT family DNA-binding domain-containing protein [Gracilibacillus boraciitolerans]GAE95471.1 prevent host death protein [Gracilibacillus boraciitolerans JCM 21714]